MRVARIELASVACPSSAVAIYNAEYENRTRASCLGSKCTAIIRIPHIATEDGGSNHSASKLYSPFYII